MGLSCLPGKEPLNRWLGGSHKLSVYFGEETYSLLLPGIELQFLFFQARTKSPISTETPAFIDKKLQTIYI